MNQSNSLFSNHLDGIYTPSPQFLSDFWLEHHQLETEVYNYIFELVVNLYGQFYDLSQNHMLYFLDCQILNLSYSLIFHWLLSLSTHIYFLGLVLINCYNLFLGLISTIFIFIIILVAMIIWSWDLLHLILTSVLIFHY